MSQIDDISVSIASLTLRDERLNYINERILQEECLDTANALMDNSLMEEYKGCKSVKTKIQKFRGLFRRRELPDATIDTLINELMLELIPAGTKGVIKGNKFNRLIQSKILEFGLDSNDFEIRFEQQCPVQKVSEIPDWYILQKSTKKYIIGMNQIDLWGGGAQINRGAKYMNQKTDSQTKLVCVVCKHIQFKSTKNKAYHIFDVGFANNTICYIKGIRRIVDEFFGL